MPTVQPNEKNEVICAFPFPCVIGQVLRGEIHAFGKINKITAKIARKSTHEEWVAYCTSIGDGVREGEEKFPFYYAVYLD